MNKLSTPIRGFNFIAVINFHISHMQILRTKLNMIPRLARILFFSNSVFRTKS